MSRAAAVFLFLVIAVLILAIAIGCALGIQKAAAERTSVPSVTEKSETNDAVQTTTVRNVPHRAPVVFRPVLVSAKLQVLDYHFFTVGYDNDRKNPAWVVYDLDGPITHPGPEAKRPSQFTTDDRAITKVHHRDYSNSGFDRGHMCPAYAMFSRYGEEGEKATFVTTNVIPQPHALNAGWWEGLEECIAGRDGKGDGWASTLRHITVINGPVYRDAPRYLPSGVAIPDACFSIVLDYVEETGMYRALAFEVPDAASTAGSRNQYLVSIKHIEEETQLDFFAGEASEVRGQVETSVATAVWP